MVLRTFFFKHKLHAGQILNFSQYLSKYPKIDQNDSKFFQSEIGTPWTKFLESPLLESANRNYWSVDRHMASANQHFPSADWYNFKAWPRKVLIKIKHIHFEFLGIIIRPNSYLIQASLFSKHQTSINRILKSKIGTPFFKLLSPLMLNKLSFALGISFLLRDFT